MIIIHLKLFKCFLMIFNGNAYKFYKVLLYSHYTRYLISEITVGKGPMRGRIIKKGEEK